MRSLSGKGLSGCLRHAIRHPAFRKGSMRATWAMVRYRRNFVPGGTYFFTVTLRDRRATTLVDHIAARRAAFARTRAARPFTTDAIVILPEHLHALVTLPDGDAEYPARWRRIKSLFTSAVAKIDPTVRPNAHGRYMLWQSRYWENTIRDADDFARHIAYIHYNPVKHGLVKTPLGWPHSSFHRFVRHAVLPPDWGAEPAHNADFGEPPYPPCGPHGALAECGIPPNPLTIHPR